MKPLIRTGALDAEKKFLWEYLERTVLRGNKLMVINLLWTRLLRGNTA